jgi:hypothetical protein
MDFLVVGLWSEKHFAIEETWSLMMAQSVIRYKSHQYDFSSEIMSLKARS